MGWLGWIHGSTMAYAGLIFAFIVLVLRGTHRLRSITLLSVSIAAMVFAGSPEMLVMLGLAAAIFVLVVLAIHWRLGEQPRNVLRTLGDLFVAGVGGAMLSAPLLLPGLQLISVSQRGVSGGDPAELLPGNPPLPAHNLIHFVFQGYDGLPIAGSKWFGYTLGYSETAAYVGLIALALAVTAVAVKRHRPVVLGFAAMTLVLVAIAFVPFVTDALSRAPAIGTVLWQRAIFPAAFGLALLGGFGLDTLVEQAVRAAGSCLGLRQLRGRYGIGRVALVVRTRPSATRGSRHQVAQLRVARSPIARGAGGCRRAPRRPPKNDHTCRQPA